MTLTWRGVIPALMTEMKQNGDLDLDATAKHIDSCLSAGCEGFVMLGTLGENSSLSPDEKAFSSGESEEFSPSVPSITKPSQPALRQESMCLAVASRSRSPFCFISVINAGMTPRQVSVISSVLQCVGGDGANWVHRNGDHFGRNGPRSDEPNSHHP